MFELVLANGKRLVTDNADELANFYESDGATIAPAPKRKHKSGKPAQAE